MSSRRHKVGKCRIEIKSLKAERPKPVPVERSQYKQVYKMLHHRGNFDIPHGYTVQICPDNVLPQSRPRREIEDDAIYANYTVDIQSEWPWVELIIALVQLAFAVGSLAISVAAGDTIEEYGYAAYSLTVLPYAAMSVSNWIANFTSRTYPFWYFAKTLEMSEARRRVPEKKDKFEGFVGRLSQIKPKETYWTMGASGNRACKGGAWVQFEATPDNGILTVNMNNPIDGHDGLEGCVQKGAVNQPVSSSSLCRLGINRLFSPRERHLPSKSNLTESSTDEKTSTGA
jgi:hypothetical protein